MADNIPLPGPAEDRRALAAIGLIFLLALGLRLWGITFGFPHVLCGTDEDLSASLAMRYGRGDFRPDSYWWPTLYTYLLFVLYAAYYVFGRLTGVFHSLLDFQKLYFIAPQPFYLIGRLLTAVSGSLTVLACYSALKKAYDSRVALMAALFLAVNFLHVRDSHFARPDVLGLFFLAMAFTRILALKRTGDYVLAGMYIGLAASVKYPYILGAVPAVAAHMLPEEGRPFSFRRLFSKEALFLALSAFAAFALTSPYVLLNLKSALASVSSVAAASRTASLKWGMGTLRYQYEYSFVQSMGLPLFAACCLGIAQALRRPSKADLILLSFTAVYFMSIVSGGSLTMRYAMPLFIPLFAFAAKFADSLYKAALERGLQVNAARAGLAALLLALCAYPAWKSARLDQLWTVKDNLVVTSEWIETNIPAGVGIAFTAPWFHEIPSLRESKGSLALGIATMDTGYRHKFLLALPDYPPEPAYRLFQFATPTAVINYPPVPADISAVLKNRIEYVVTSEHYSTSPQYLPGEVKKILDADFTLVKELLPYGPGADPKPVFEDYPGSPPPCGRFAGIDRPGPIVRIWRLKSAVNNRSGKK